MVTHQVYFDAYAACRLEYAGKVLRRLRAYKHTKESMHVAHRFPSVLKVFKVKQQHPAGV